MNPQVTRCDVERPGISCNPCGRPRSHSGWSGRSASTPHCQRVPAPSREECRHRLGTPGIPLLHARELIPGDLGFFTAARSILDSAWCANTSGDDRTTSRKGRSARVAISGVRPAEPSTSTSGAAICTQLRSRAFRPSPSTPTRRRNLPGRGRIRTSTGPGRSVAAQKASAGRPRSAAGPRQERPRRSISGNGVNERVAIERRPQLDRRSRSARRRPGRHPPA